MPYPTHESKSGTMASSGPPARGGRLSAAWRDWMASQDALSIVLTLVLVGVAALLSITAWQRAHREDVPEAVERARRQFEAGDTHGAFMTLHAYGMAIDERLARVEDPLLRDQLRNLWIQMRAGAYHRPFDLPFPPELQGAVHEVLHPEALLLAAEILTGHASDVLGAHARALESGAVDEPDWDVLARAANHLPRTLATVAVQNDPALRGRVLALLRPAVRDSVKPCTPALSARLLPHFEGLALARSPEAAHAALDALAGEGGDAAVVSLLAGPALDALAAVDEPAAERVRMRLERLAARVYSPAFRANLAAALHERLCAPDASACH
jgi:hypothetical protein